MALAAPVIPLATPASTWISANAGSGKTRALVERVVTLLLLGVAPERICCITYTKAAAGEMRERVLKSLRALLVMNESDCRAEVQRLAGHTDIALARSLFARVLDSPFGGPELTTIHGFCQKLLRRFPLESGLSPQFSVLEERESERLQRAARQRMLADAETHSELATALALIAERSGEHTFNDIIKLVASQYAWWDAVGETHGLPEQLRAAIFAHHAIAPDTTEEQLRAALCAQLIPVEWEAELRAAIPQLKSATELKLVPVLTRWLENPSPESRDALLDDFLAIAVTKDEGTPKKLVTKNAPAQEYFATIAERCANHVQQIRALACAQESYAIALMARAFLTEYRRLKDDAQALDYDDLIERTERLLREHGGWVMSQLDHRIDHLLVDEAQDTGPGQWRIVRTLVEELMATGDGIGSAGVPRSLLVVGDEKQSIYSFNGADPRQFASESRAFETMLSTSGKPFERRALEYSYRSAQAILTLVDAVAAQPEVAPALSAAGIPGRHIFQRQERSAGEIILHPPIAETEKPKPEPFVLPTEYQLAESTAQRLADQMAADIKGWVDAGRYTPGDILILLWHRRPYADCLIRALETAGVPVAGIDRLKLAKHLAVQDLLTLMRWCGHTGDDLALAQLLRSPLIGIDEQALEDLTHNRPGTLWDALQSPTHDALSAPLHAWHAARDRTPYGFLTFVLEVMGGRQHFATRFGEEVHEVLDELKAQAAALPHRVPPTIAAFTDWIERSELIVKREQEGSGHAVRIMTVHGAKGLEAPVVLVVSPSKNPDTSRERSLKGEGSIPLVAFSADGVKAAAYLAAKEATKRQLFQEYYRLLYVALTRPRDALHIYAAGKVPEASWYDLVARTMKQLPTVEEDGKHILRDAGELPAARSATTHTTTPLPAWAHQPAPPPPARLRMLSPSRLAEAPLPAGMGIAGANIRGERLHRVLQFLRADSDAAHIAQLIALAAPDWDDTERTAAAGEITRLHQQERWLWEQPGHAEISIGGTLAGQRFSGQIDRLVMGDNEIIVVDYKTGAHVPAAPAAAPEGYRLQLKVYEGLLAQLYPGKRIRTALLWTSMPSLMWMDEAVAATTLPDLTKN